MEGEGSLRVEVRDGVVEKVALNIFEPPRFFEALLQGRGAMEAPDITARICGICPVAYQMSACAAIEDALGVTVSREVARLRRLLYCGEWIQSHALHIYLLHAPDFLGCADAVELAELDRTAVERGLAIKKTGNLMMATVGGRAIHPVNVRVGGFYSAPDVADIAALTEPLRRARDLALETVYGYAGFDFPGNGRGLSFRFAAHSRPISASNQAASSRATDSISLRRPSTSWWSRSTWNDPPPCTPGLGGAARLPHRAPGSLCAELVRPASLGTGSRNRSRLGAWSSPIRFRASWSEPSNSSSHAMRLSAWRSRISPQARRAAGFHCEPGSAPASPRRPVDCSYTPTR